MNYSFFKYLFLNIGLTLLSLIFFFPLYAYAEKELKTVEADEIIQPLPLRLTPQWWCQFSQANYKNLKEHIQQF